MRRLVEQRSRFRSDAIVGAAKSAASWALGPITRGRGSDLDIVAELRALEPDVPDERWKDLTEELLYLMYVPVTGALGAAFAEVRELANRDSETLLALAQDLFGHDIEVTADDLALPRVAVDHATWLPVARTTVLVLLDWLVFESEEDANVTRSLPASDWVLRAMKSEAFEVERFRRATALDEFAAVTALEATAAAIIAWEPVVIGVPMRYLGRYVFVHADGDGTITCEQDDPLTRLQPIAAFKTPAVHQLEDSGRHYRMLIDDWLRIEPVADRIALANNGKNVTVVSQSARTRGLAAHTSRYFRIDGEWHQENDGDAIVVRPKPGGTLRVSVPIDHAFADADGDLLMKPQA